MPSNRNRGKKPASDEDRHDDQNGSRKSPAFPYEAGENSEKGFQGYDEDRDTFNPQYQQDFDVDENNINKKRRNTRI